MIPDIDIWRCADEMTKRYSKADMASGRVSRQIVRAIKEMGRKMPEGAVH